MNVTNLVKMKSYRFYIYGSNEDPGPFIENTTVEIIEMRTELIDVAHARQLLSAWLFFLFYYFF